MNSERKQQAELDAFQKCFAVSPLGSIEECIVFFDNTRELVCGMLSTGGSLYTAKICKRDSLCDNLADASRKAIQILSERISVDSQRVVELHKSLTAESPSVRQ